MTEDFYCINCKKFVSAPVVVTFEHPHLGVRNGKACPVCLYPVMLKELKKEE